MTHWLIDTSALVRLDGADAVWLERIDRGLVHLATVTRLEVGWTARSAGELDELFSQPPLVHLPHDFMTPTIESRAVEVQRLLTADGQHRGPGASDLLLAALAEALGLVVLHVDRDFELIAGVTGQPVERLL